MLSQGYLASVATRRVIIIESNNPEIGKVALIFIGMADISSCLSHLKIGDHVEKGEYIGHF